MGQNVGFDAAGAENFITQKEIDVMMQKIGSSFRKLKTKSGLGKEFLGWVNLPKNYDKDEFKRIKEAAKKIRSDSKFLIVIGIGGSYLGAKAAIDFLGEEFASHYLDFNVIFAGNNLSTNYINSLLKLIENKDVSLNIISKSGQTLEPAISFRIFRKFLVSKYGEQEAKKRIYVTTDKSKGNLRSFSNDQGYECFVIPDDIGGRFSVLTPVGLLPICAYGCDIDSVMLGAQYGMENFLLNDNSKENISLKYALIRNILLEKGKCIEILVNYNPELKFLTKWWVQLFGESEGKNHKGVFPASLDFTTDLHSMGQYIQEGTRNIFETVFYVQNTKSDIFIKNEPSDFDSLNFLSGKTLDYINKKAFEGTRLSHVEGGVPNLTIKLSSLSEVTFGELIYFFEIACAVSGYTLGVNPFDQPGVEKYKESVFHLLGKLKT